MTRTFLGLVYVTCKVDLNFFLLLESTYKPPPKITCETEEQSRFVCCHNR